MKVEAVCYLDTTQHDVWHGTEEYEDETTAWNNFKQAIYKLYPGSGQECQINLMDIITFTEASTKPTYLNEKELSVYYWQLLSKTNARICTNQLSTCKQSLLYLQGLPPCLQQETTL